MTRDRNSGVNLLDRRHFVARAGLLATGAAFYGPLLGCSDFKIDIPCLGPAPPPTPVPGTTYIRASQIGCALDCDLSSGRNKHTGGVATDDAPRINAAMAGASASNPITLILDGSALISGLFMPSGGYWSIAGLGCGTGFFVKSGTNNDGIHNGPPNAAVPSDPGPPAPPRGTNVSLSNFTINGNQGNGRDGDSNTGARQGVGNVWYYGVNLINLDNISLQNLVVVNTPAYHIRLSNVGNVAVSGCVMKSFGTNTDGVHFDGPANDIAVSGCDFTTGDDSIALNCPEGYTGDISRVKVTDCTFNSFSLMRLYTTNGGTAQFNIDTVSVSNCTGVFSEAAFLIGAGESGNPNSVASLSISDCTLTAPAVLGIAENFGDISADSVTFIPSQSNVWWAKLQSNHVCAFLRPSPPYGDVPYVGSSLLLENCKILRTGGINVAAAILEGNSSIGNLRFNGFALIDAGSYSGIPGLLSLGRATIGQLVLDSLDSSNIKAPASEGGLSGVGTVSGSGVLGTHWKFPDSVMADAVPYISAESGRPSIKVGGIVEPFELSLSSG